MLSQPFYGVVGQLLLTRTIEKPAELFGQSGNVGNEQQILSVRHRPGLSVLPEAAKSLRQVHIVSLQQYPQPVLKVAQVVETLVKALVRADASDSYTRGFTDHVLR